ncbi:MAG: sulfatase family protein [Sphingobacterium sp.]
MFVRLLTTPFQPIFFTFLIFFLTIINVTESFGQSEKKGSRPNFLIIMADDLDSRQLSSYGGENLQTPHIDRLAEEGMKFNHMIASEAMCVPTRASLFTGLYPVRHGAYQNHKPVRDELKSVVHYLKELGYRVGLTGKDHVTQPREIFPFDIIPGFEPNCVAETDEYFLDSVAAYIQADDPYCLFVMSANPHAPWTVGNPDEFNADELVLPNHWVDTDLTREQFTRYLAEVRRLDNQVGDVMQSLENADQLDNTIIIFLGEQGAQFPGAKWTLYDHGQRSSMLIRWPGTITEGVETDAIVQFEDIAPTLVEIAGGQVPSELDGRSFMSVIRDPNTPFRPYAFGIHNNIPEGPAFPMRSIRDNQYKLIVNLTPENAYHIKYMTDTSKPGQAYTSWVRKGEVDPMSKKLADRIVQHPTLEFYDLENDPDELVNLADQTVYQKRIARMKKELELWMKEQGDTGADLDKPLK